MKEAVAYDPFVRGSFPVGVRTFQALDDRRHRTFTCEVWYPAAPEFAGGVAAVRDAASHPGTYPLVAYSHCSGGNRCTATFLCAHLASQGYIVASLDHSETFVPELMRRDGESPEQRRTRSESAVASRVPDLRFLVDQVLDRSVAEVGADCDADKIGIVGHSFGGWTVLSMPEVDSRVRAIVAHAPGGNSNPRPGILRAPLTFEWGRNVPVLYLVAENDTLLPMDGMRELFERTRSSKQMVVLRRADHAHFMEDVEQEHEKVRTAPMSGEWAYIQKEMRPIGELHSGDQAHVFVRGLTLAHLDAVLKGSDAAKRFLVGDVGRELQLRGIDGFCVHRL
jgi:predicted dienelactone hydrolase